MLALSVLFAGCGGGETGRVAFSGRVTRQGEPISNGFLTYRPAEGHTGPAANTDIVDGVYRFTSSDGPFPGPYLVTVSVATVGSKAAGRALTVDASRWEFEVLVRADREFSADFQLDAP